MGEFVEYTSDQKNFRDATLECESCRKFCEDKNLYEDNVHTRSALACLGGIKDSSKYFQVAKAAKYKCESGCDHKSTGIISIIESSEIDLH